MTLSRFAIARMKNYALWQKSYNSCILVRNVRLPARVTGSLVESQDIFSVIEYGGTCQKILSVLGVIMTRQ